MCTSLDYPGDVAPDRLPGEMDRLALPWEDIFPSLVLHENMSAGPGEMAQGIKALTIEPDNLSSILRTPVVEGETELLKVIL